LKRGLIPKSGRRNDDGEMIELEGGYLYNGWNDEGTIMMSSDIEVGRQVSFSFIYSFFESHLTLFELLLATTSSIPRLLGSRNRFIVPIDKCIYIYVSELVTR